MKGAKTLRNSSRGRDVASAVVSAFWMAIDFGASSPNTTWSTVMITKAMITAVAAEVAPPIPIDSKTGSSSSANAGSPSQPSPRLASVMPSWQAAR